LEHKVGPHGSPILRPLRCDACPPEYLADDRAEAAIAQCLKRLFVLSGRSLPGDAFESRLGQPRQYLFDPGIIENVDSLR
jgi:hypothetical protein